MTTRATQGSCSGHRRGSWATPYREAWRNTMIAGDLMTPDPITVTPEASVAEAWDLMRDLDIRHLPVVEGGPSSACVSDRDLGRMDMAGILASEGADALRVGARHAGGEDHERGRDRGRHRDRPRRCREPADRAQGRCAADREPRHPGRGGHPELHRRAEGRSRALFGTTTSRAARPRLMADTSVLRKDMVQHQIAARGVSDERVLDAMRVVPREAFMPDELGEFAYEDTPLPIEEGQTISQPYIVALMIAAIEPRPDARVLEIGTGSGYAAAVLSRVVGEVYTVERHEGARRPGAPPLRDARVRQRRRAARRRDARLAGARPVRCDRRDGGRAARAAAAPRSARRRRPPGDSDRRRRRACSSSSG